MRPMILAICLPLTACATVETAADRTRDFVDAHPVACSVVASVAVTSVVTTLALRRAQNQADAQLAAALAPRHPVSIKTP